MRRYSQTVAISLQPRPHVDRAAASDYFSRSDITLAMFQFQTMTTSKRRRDDDSDSEEERNFKVRMLCNFVRHLTDRL